MHINSTILLIGSGRLSRHLKHWNSLLDKPNFINLWERSEPIEKLKLQINQSTMVWLAISDSAIVEFFETFILASGKKAVHFSGALNDKRILAAHPLMSFPKDLLPNEIYKKIHFVINGCEKLEDALPGFTNSYTHLNVENKSLYHALCVLSGNFPQLLWNDVSQKMQQMNIPESALDLYIQQISSNYIHYKKNALTGPIVRNDQKTISANLQSLERDPQLQNIYGAFELAFNKELKL